MSFILDALKKIEREQKAAAAAGEGERPYMTGGRRWHEGSRAMTWGLLGIGLLTVTAIGISVLALVQGLERSGPAPGPEMKSAAPQDLPADGVGPPADIGAPQKIPLSPKAPAPVVEAPTPAPSAPVPEAAPIESVVETESLSAPPVRLVGRNAAAATGPDDGVEAGSTKIPEGLPELVLQGTSVIDGKPVAVVNYQRVFVGDVIEGAVVVVITDRTVELEYQGTRFTLRL